MTEHVYTLAAITGHFAMWAVRLSSTPIPDNLGKALVNLNDYIKSKFTSEDENKFIFKSCESEMKSALGSFAMNNPYIIEWCYPVKFGAGDQWGVYEPTEKQEDEFIDLNSLLGNVCDSIHREIVESDEFGEEIDKEMEREQNK